MNIMNPPPPAPETLPPIAPSAKARRYSCSIVFGADAGGGAFLRLPGVVQQHRHVADLASQQRLFHFHRVALQLMQSLDRRIGDRRPFAAVARR